VSIVRLPPARTYSRTALRLQPNFWLMHLVSHSCAESASNAVHLFRLQHRLPPTVTLDGGSMGDNVRHSNRASRFKSLMRCCFPVMGYGCTTAQDFGSAVK
jgi:hypothetical protein